MSTPTEDPAPRAWRVPISGIVAVALLPLLFAAALGAVRPDLWVVERVVFEGADRAKPAGLRHLADVPNGTTLWQVDPDAAARGVTRHPWVRSATAELSWATLHVHVQEHTPVALLAGARMQYICREGVAFAPADTDDLDYPVITGVGAELAELHPELPRQVLVSAIALLDTLGDAGLVPHERVGELHFSATTGFTLHVTDGAQVVFALEGFERQAKRLARLLDEGLSLDDKIYIDLAPATVAIVRPTLPEPSSPTDASEADAITASGEEAAGGEG